MRQELKIRSSFAEVHTQLDEYAEFLRQAGKPFRRAARAEAERAYQRLDEAGAARVASRLRCFLEILRAMSAGGESLNDSPKFLWRYMAQNGYRPCSDVFDHIGERDVVEVFGLDHTHLFLNLNFFDFFSITLERLFIETWYQATRREPHIVRQIQDALITPIQRGEVHHTLTGLVPPHVVEEVDTEMMLKVTWDVKAVAPFYVGQQLAGFVSVAGCELL